LEVRIGTLHYPNAAYCVLRLFLSVHFDALILFRFSTADFFSDALLSLIAFTQDGQVTGSGWGRMNR
ncbi:hypothetical protein LCGC14_1978710, partial [marine sediment metagenome]